MKTRDIQSMLHDIGWPIAVDGNFGPSTATAVKDFQRGFAVTTLIDAYPLAVDGAVGERTERALRYSRDHDGACSAHFVFREFADDNPDNHWIRVRRQLVTGLEKYRARVGDTIDIISGFRDAEYNKKVGGVPESQHLYGCAADISPRLTLAMVHALDVFSGIGVQEQSGLVRHVDVRHVGPNNTTKSTVEEPAVWYYT